MQTPETRTGDDDVNRSAVCLPDSVPASTLEREPKHHEQPTMENRRKQAQAHQRYVCEPS